MSKARYKRLLEALEELKEAGPTLNDMGICTNVSDLTHGEFGSLDISHLAMSWPQHSGNHTFPIPSTNKKFDSKDYYDNHDRKWKGRQGLLRRDLLNYLIRKVRRLAR
jgi:hypothetical protein